MVAILKTINIVYKLRFSVGNTGHNYGSIFFSHTTKHHNDNKITYVVLCKSHIKRTGGEYRTQLLTREHFFALRMQRQSNSDSNCCLIRISKGLAGGHVDNNFYLSWEHIFCPSFCMQTWKWPFDDGATLFLRDLVTAFGRRGGSWHWHGGHSE